MHPTYILKSQKVPDLQAIRAELEAHVGGVEEEKELVGAWLFLAKVLLASKHCTWQGT
jgi:hypothetical protein